MVSRKKRAQEVKALKEEAEKDNREAKTARKQYAQEVKAQTKEAICQEANTTRQAQQEAKEAKRMQEIEEMRQAAIKHAMDNREREKIARAAQQITKAQRKNDNNRDEKAIRDEAKAIRQAHQNSKVS